MTKIVRSVASLSWIDPQTGLPKVDEGGHPGNITTRSIILGEVAYRFSNFLEAEIEVNDEGTRITRAGFTPASCMCRSPSLFGHQSAPVGQIGRSSNIQGNTAVFRQVVGCRTESPETIGSGVGTVVGAGVGLYFFGILGLVAGAIGGHEAGREAAEAATGFPPIWTELELTINLDGSTIPRLISHSLFPSATFYRLDLSGRAGSYREVSNYNAVPALDRWQEHGWGGAVIPRSGATGGNPWNMTSGRFRLGGHTVNRQCPIGYTCN